MITYVTGDILSSGAQVIVQSVAPHDHFDNGLALALREQWPAMAKDFRHYCHQQNPDPGNIWLWANAEGRRIVSLMAQEPAANNQGHPGPASLSNLNHCLKALRKLIEKEQFASVALPKLATGVGRLDWNDVKPLIEQHLADLDCPVYVYENYIRGQKAQEPLPRAA